MAANSIWVTGSRGFIGRRVVASLNETGARLVCLTNQKAQGTPADGCVQLDYLDPADIAAKVDQHGVPEVFIHIGWGDMASPESEGHLGENVQAGKNLIRTLFERGLRKFLFVGSMNEYGARTGLLSEDMPPEGRLTNYARGKIEVATYGFEAAREFGKIFLHARTFYVFGAGQRAGSLLNDLYQAHRAGREVSLSPCEHFRDYIHVSEVAEGLKRIAGLQQSVTLNLGSGVAVKVRDYVRLFWKLLGNDESRLKFGARELRPGEPEQPQSYADLRRLREALGWTPSLTLEAGLRQTIRDLDRAAA